MSIKFRHAPAYEPLFIAKCRYAWEVSDSPDAPAVLRMLANMTECFRQLTTDAADCADDVRECIVGRQGCMAVFEDAVGDLKLRAWAWEDDRAARQHGNRLDNSRAWHARDVGRL